MSVQALYEDFSEEYLFAHANLGGI